MVLFGILILATGGASRASADTISLADIYLLPGSHLAARDVTADTWHAVFIRPATSIDDFVQIVMASTDGDRSVMKYTTASQLVARLNQMYPWLGLENRQDLVNYIRAHGRVGSCGSGKAKFDVVRANGTFVPGARERLIDSGENCLFVPDPNNPGREVSLFSMKCGNPTPFIARRLAVTTTPAVKKEDPPSFVERPQPTFTKSDTTIVKVDVGDVVIRDERGGGFPYGKTALGLVAASIAGCTISTLAFDKPCFRFVFTSSSSSSSQ